MPPLPGRLGQLRARDVMTRWVTTLRTSDALREAARVLREAQISGAPVVNDAGRPVGVLSATDIVIFEREKDSAAAKKRHPPHRPQKIGDGRRRNSSSLNRENPWHKEDEWERIEVTGLDLDRIPTATVEEYMSPRVLSVNEDVTLLAVARKMCEHHMHRLIVVDGEDRLLGIISTMDILAAVVGAADEAENRP